MYAQEACQLKKRILDCNQPELNLVRVNDEMVWGESDGVIFVVWAAICWKDKMECFLTLTIYMVNKEGKPAKSLKAVEYYERLIPKLERVCGENDPSSEMDFLASLIGKNTCKARVWVLSTDRKYYLDLLDPKYKQQGTYSI